MQANRTEEALDRLSQGLADLVASGNWRAYLRMQSRFHTYSANNVILIFCQRPDATRVAGFHAWKSLGRSVKKGEKALYILAPVLGKAEDSTEDNARRVRGFKTVAVFDYSQTEGEDLPEPPQSALQGDDSGLFDALERYALATGWQVERQALPTGMGGYAHFQARRIGIAEGASARHAAKTLAHELAHTLLHNLEQYADHRADWELEAESVAFVVCDYFGIDSADFSLGYVASWQQDKEAVETLKLSAARIHRAARQLIEAVEGQQQTEAQALAA